MPPLEDLVFAAALVAIVITRVAPHVLVGRHLERFNSQVDQKAK